MATSMVGNKPGSQHSEEQAVLDEVKGRLQVITLNNPHKMNIMSREVAIRLVELFEEWEKENDAEMMIIKGVGRAFCAGGDLRGFYYGKADKQTIEVIYKTYWLYYRIHTNKKTLVFAAPEVGFGFHTESGLSYILSHLSGHLGEYLALTGSRLDGVEMIATGLGTHYIPSEKLEELEKRLIDLNTGDKNLVKATIEEFTVQVQLGEKSILHNSSLINQCFSNDTVEDIMESLATASDMEGNEWVKGTIKKLKSSSPIALKMTLRSVLHCPMPIIVVTNMKFHGRDSARSLLIGQNIMLFYFIILVPTFINITFHGHICNAATTKCDGSNHTEGSMFEKNLNIVFDRLAEGANKTGFNISVYGQSPDKIYGLLQCREDMTVDQCFSCWQFATTNIREICGNAVGGSIWPFQCFLRYGNYNFIGQLDTDLGSNYAEPFGGNTVVFVPPDFEATAQNLLKKLSIEAASETKRSALSIALDSASQTIYGLVQCTRDLSTRDCRSCLSYSISKMFTSDTAAGIQYWSQSCILRYAIYPFFNSTAFAVNSTQGVANKAHEAKSSHKSTHIILGIVGGLALVFMACAFATRKRLKSATFGKGYEDEENTATDPDGHMVFKMETLQGATNNFHDDNKLGEEGFGPVYKIQTQTQTNVAGSLMGRSVTTS